MTSGDQGKGMKTVFVPENHYVFSTLPEVIEICRFLLPYGITNFFYMRVFDDHKLFALINNPDYLKYFVKKEYKLTPPIPPFCLREKFFYLGLPQDSSPFNQVYYEARNLFNIDHIIYLIERYDDYYDTYSFASTPNNPQIINFYLNNMELLEKFKFFFKEKAAKLIERSYENRVIIPPEKRPSFGGLNNPVNKNDMDYPQGLLPQMSIRHYNIDYHNKKISLTQREIESIQCLCHGYSIKEAARHLAISPRTVESYLNNVKDKLNLQKKSELIDIIEKFNLKIPQFRQTRIKRP